MLYASVRIIFLFIYLFIAKSEQIIEYIYAGEPVFTRLLRIIFLGVECSVLVKKFTQRNVAYNCILLDFC